MTMTTDADSETLAHQCQNQLDFANEGEIEVQDVYETDPPFSRRWMIQSPRLPN